MVDPTEILAEGKYLRLVRRRDWEFAERMGARGVVVIVPVTADGSLLFVEQYRQPVDMAVIEFPAGLVGDEPELAAETYQAAAARELLEETGYGAGEPLRYLARGATSSGLTSEIVEFYLATGLTQQAAGGGVGSERIVVHAVARQQATAWLAAAEARGCLVSSLVFAGLHLLEQHVA